MTPSSKKTSVAIYARFSTDRQDARSIDDQVRRCRTYAEKQGFTVVAEYADEAQSGAHMERVEMQRMMTDAQRSGGARFSAVLVDDLSRLSRDIWDMGNLVFRHLAGVGITLVDVNTGMASDNIAARTTFAALGIANDAFLQLVRTETHRGLEGRALGGFATGGRVYGYSSEKEANPPDKDHPRSIYKINPEQAEVVRRVFKLYAEGVGQRTIASMLNSERVPAPYDRSHKNKTGQGWGHSTVRSMLLNTRYIGKWRWNVRQWVRVPGKKSKKALFRDDGIIENTYPKLRVIDDELWARVQSRFAGRKDPRKARPPGVGKIPHALSGYLHCGVCGNTMHIVSSVTKNERRYVNYGCSARDSKGPGACSNKMTVSELTAIRDVFTEVKRRLKDPKLVDEFLKGYAKQDEARKKRGAHDPAAKLRSQLPEQQRRVDRLAEAVANAGWSDALGKQLREEEAKLSRLRAELEQVVEIQAPTQAPSEAWLRKYFDNLILLTEAAPTRGKQALQGWFGPVKVIPVGEGPEAHYEAEGTIRVGPAILADSGAFLDKSHCGGRI